MRGRTKHNAGKREGKSASRSFIESCHVLTSTLNGCSSPFTAHKTHSNNCKHNVPIQQLPRHLLRAAGNTIVNPAVVACCLRTVLFTVSAGERTGINPTRLEAALPMSRGLSCGAESRREEEGKRGRRSGFLGRCFRGSGRGGVIPGERVAVNACQRSAGPVVPGRVLRCAGRCSKRTRPARFLQRAA